MAALSNQSQILKLIFTFAGIPPGSVNNMQVSYILLRRSASGGRMIIALLVAGILALVIAVLVFFSAMQDVNDDY